MIELQVMSEAEFEAYKTWEVEDYAKEIATNYRIPIEEARLNASQQINTTLAQGLNTPNHTLYMIVNSTEPSKSNIGYLWISVEEDRKSCFIYDIYLHPEFRNHGWGRSTLELLETVMKQRGIKRIGLHVFSNNKIAQELYQKLDYQVTGWNMQKWLDD